MAALPCAHVTATRIVVRPRDMDADRNVNNAVYFEYLHQARLEHLSRLGIWTPPQKRSGNLFAVAENTCRYLGPAYYGDVLAVWTATHALGRSSFKLVYQVWRDGSDMLIAAGHSVQVWLDEANRPTALPEAARAALSDALCSHLPELPTRK